MSTIVTIQSTDVISSSRTDLNTNFSNLNTDKIETSYLDTDTALTANSDSKIATQKATKAYVDASVNPTGRSWNEYAADSVGTDSYAITVSGVSAYVTGMTFKFKAGTANTGAATLNVNALGAKTIKKDYNSDLSTGDILANQIVEVVYDGTNMQLTSFPASVTSATQGGQRTIPLGESFTGATTPQPAVIINDLFQFKVDFACTGGSATSIFMGWNTTYIRKRALRIIPRTTITSTTAIALVARSSAGLVDNIRIVINTDSAGAPSGTPITNGTSNTIAGSSLQASLRPEVFTFASAFTLTAGTTYWVVIERDGSNSDTNYYLVGGAQYDRYSGTSGSTNPNYASFQGLAMNTSGTWQTANYNSLPYIEIIPSSTAGSYSLWQSDADATVDIMKNYSGICTTTGNAGDSGTIVTNGSCSGFTGLIPGADYYVSTTKGSITTTSNGQFVGTATSATQLSIPNQKFGTPIFYGTMTSGSSGGIQGSTIRIPYDGLFCTNAGGNSSGAPTMTVADKNDGTTNAFNFVTVANCSVSIPVRRGQYLKSGTVAANSDLIFIPKM